MEVRRLQRKDYKHWIKNIHYAKRLPNVMFAFGLILEKKNTWCLYFWYATK